MFTAGKVGAVGLAAGLAYSIKKAADFESQLSSLKAVTRASGRQMEVLRGQALKSGAATKYSALEAAKAQTELAKGGLSVTQIMRGGLRSALALAAAGEMDLAAAAETTANALKLFGLRGSKSMKVADALATAANSTTADVKDFALALKMGGSVAKLAGLSFNSTVVALEALAEAGIKGSDAGTSLKSFFLNIGTPSLKAAKAMRGLGMDIFTATGELKPLPAIAGNLRHAFGDLTKEQFLNKAGVIAGSDAVRTLYSLYDAGPEKLRKLAAATSEHGTAADVARIKQDNLAGAIEHLGGSFETLGITVGSKMLPSLTLGTQALTKWVNTVNRIAAREDLNLGQKIELSMKAAERQLGPSLDRIATELEQAGLGDKLGKGFSEAMEFVAEQAAHAAPKAVNAFFDAWRGADAWGKLIAGAWLMHKFGGFAMFRTLGQKAGGEMALGMTAGMAAGGAGGAAGAAVGAAAAKGSIQWVKGPGGAMIAQTGVAMGQGMATGASTGVMGRLRGMAGPMKAVGKGTLGVALGMGILDGVSSAMAGERGFSFGDHFQRASSTATMGLIPEPKAIDERLSTIASRIQTWKDSGALKLSDPNDPDRSLIRQEDLDDFTGAEKKLLTGMARLRNNANQMFGAGTRLIDEAWINPDGALRQLELLQNGWARMRSNFVVNAQGMRQAADDNLVRISKTLGVNSAAGKEAVRRNFSEAARWIRVHMSDGKGLTAEGAAEMERLLRTHTSNAKNAVKTHLGDIVSTIEATMSRSGKLTAEGRTLIKWAYEVGIASAASDGKLGAMSAQIDRLRDASMPAKTKIAVLKATIDKVRDSAWGTSDQVAALRDEIALLKGKKINVGVNLKLNDMLNGESWGGGAFGNTNTPAGPSGGPSGGPDLEGRVRRGSKKKVQEAINSGKLDPFGLLGPLIPGAGGKVAGVDGFNPFAGKYGLSITSGFRAGDDGYHGVNRARDYSNGGGPTPGMMGFARFMFGKFGSQLKELIYSPMGVGIKDGRPVNIMGFYGRSVYDDHMDHVHVAYAKGGRRARSHRQTSPNVMYAEEAPAHPEYFISTNPRDKQRSLGLLAQATQEIAGGSGKERMAYYRHGARRGGGTNKWNQTFSQHGLSDAPGKPQMSERGIRMLLEQYGRLSPYIAAVLAKVFRKRESLGYPGIVASDGGTGLGQITNWAWPKGSPLHGILAKLGGMKAMRNPVQNAKMVGALVEYSKRDGASPLQPWAASNTGQFAASVPNDIDSVFGKGGVPKGGGGALSQKVLAGYQKSFTKKSARLQEVNSLLKGGGLKKDRREKLLDEQKTLKGDLKALKEELGDRTPTKGRHKLNLEERLTRNDRATARAETTGGKGDDRKAGWARIKLLQEQQAKKRKRLAKINKALKGKLTPAARQRLLQERSTLLSDMASMPGEATSTLESLAGAGAKQQRLQKAAKSFGIGAPVPETSPAQQRAQLAWEQAQGTPGKADDRAAAKTQVDLARVALQAAQKSGDLGELIEATQNLNQATENLESLTPKATDYMDAALVRAKVLTPDDLNDDRAALNQQLAYWEGAFRSALATEDPFDDIEAGNALMGVRDALKALNDTLSESQRDDILKSIEENQRKILALADQGKLIEAAVAAMLDGTLGARAATTQRLDGVPAWR
ncbi:MAG TPA: phage tail tape measure protein [Thermoleophilaceae bacterium]|nr:phage tail tape measure protein [Thermoleophilaceae bacterium]